MKQKVSIFELQKYCQEKQFHQITFNIQNQNWYHNEPCVIDLRFTQILVSENPSSVCLRNGQNVVQFNGVRAAEIDTERSVLGTAITLICGWLLPNEPEITYTLFAN